MVELSEGTGNGLEAEPDNCLGCDKQSKLLSGEGANDSVKIVTKKIVSVVPEGEDFENAGTFGGSTSLLSTSGLWNIQPFDNAKVFFSLYRVCPDIFPFSFLFSIYLYCLDMWKLG